MAWGLQDLGPPGVARNVRSVRRPRFALKKTKTDSEEKQTNLLCFGVNFWFHTPNIDEVVLI